MEKLNTNPLGLQALQCDPAELDRLKIKTHNETAGSLEHYNCTKCLNRGDIAVLKDGGGVAFVDCDCVRIRRCIAKMEQSGLREVIRDYTFEAFNDSEEWQKSIKQGAMAYAANASGWLLFCGQSGSGKTHLCTAVCRKLLLDGAEVVYMPWREDARAVKNIDQSRQAEELARLKNAAVLYIDDLWKVGRSADGSCNPTAADVNLAFEIINYRYTKRLPTIISTEKTPEELVNIDEATGGRIVEMANANTYCISKQPGRNYRLRNVVTV